jgi:hypothetical protein
MLKESSDLAMKPKFEIVSYVGAKPLLFGMTEAQADRFVGQPLSKRLNFRGELDAQYEWCSIRFDPQNGTLLEVGFTSFAHVKVCGLDLSRDPDAFRKIIQQDSCPYELHGFVVLLDLGITLTGFHDRDPNQLAVTAFTRGRWDTLKIKLKRFALS